MVKEPPTEATNVRYPRRARPWPNSTIPVKGNRTTRFATATSLISPLCLPEERRCLCHRHALDEPLRFALAMVGNADTHFREWKVASSTCHEVSQRGRATAVMSFCRPPSSAGAARRCVHSAPSRAWRHSAASDRCGAYGASFRPVLAPCDVRVLSTMDGASQGNRRPGASRRRPAFGCYSPARAAPTLRTAVDMSGPRRHCAIRRVTVVDSPNSQRHGAFAKFNCGIQEDCALGTRLYDLESNLPRHSA